MKKNRKNRIKITFSNLSQTKKEYNSANNTFKSDDKRFEKIKKKYYEKHQIKSNTFYSNNNKTRNLFFSQANSSSSEFIKTKYNNYHSHNSKITKTNKKPNFINKFSPGYIYYKEYQNIIDKICKKKVNSGKILVKKNGDTHNIEGKKRYKSGNYKNIYNINLNNDENNNFTKLNNLPKIHKRNVLSHKNYKNNIQNNFKTPYMYLNYLNDKFNPYSLHWTKKVLNNNDIYLGINFGSSVPFLKSINIQKNPIKTSYGKDNNKKEVNKKKKFGYKKIENNQKFIKGKNNNNLINVNIGNNNEKNIKKIEEIKEDYNKINTSNNINSNLKYEINEEINEEKENDDENNINNSEDLNNNIKNDIPDNKILSTYQSQYNKEKNIGNIKLENKNIENDKNGKKVNIISNNINNNSKNNTKIQIFDNYDDNKPRNESQNQKKNKESIKEKEDEGKVIRDVHNFTEKLFDEILNNLKNSSKKEIIKNDINNNDNKDIDKKDKQKKFAKIFDNNFNDNEDGSKNEIEEDISINDETEKQFNTNQRNFFKVRKDIKEVSENLEYDNDESDNNVNKSKKNEKSLINEKYKNNNDNIGKYIDKSIDDDNEVNDLEELVI